jgi:hypothetical protein
MQSDNPFSLARTLLARPTQSQRKTSARVEEIFPKKLASKFSQFIERKLLAAVSKRREHI